MCMYFWLPKLQPGATENSKGQTVTDNQRSKACWWPEQALDTSKPSPTRLFHSALTVTLPFQMHESMYLHLFWGTKWRHCGKDDHQTSQLLDMLFYYSGCEGKLNAKSTCKKLLDKTTLLVEYSNNVQTSWQTFSQAYHVCCQSNMLQDNHLHAHVIPQQLSPHNTHSHCIIVLQDPHCETLLPTMDLRV